MGKRGFCRPGRWDTVFILYLLQIFKHPNQASTFNPIKKNENTQASLSCGYIQVVSFIFSKKVIPFVYIVAYTAVYINQLYRM